MRRRGRKSKKRSAPQRVGGSYTMQHAGRFSEKPVEQAPAIQKSRSSLEAKEMEFHSRATSRRSRS